MASNSTKRAQFPIRGQGQSKCPNHQLETVFFCKDCAEKLICVDCINSTHQDHRYGDISDIASYKKLKIQNYVTKTEKAEIPNIKRRLEFVDKKLYENSRTARILTDKIQTQGEKLKAEIDKITTDLTTTIRQIEQSNHDILSQYKVDLQSLYTDLCQRVDKCKQALNSGDNVTVIDVEKNTHEKDKQLTVPELQALKFTEGQGLATQLLQDGVGSISIKDELAESEEMKYKSKESVVSSEFKHLIKIGITSIEKSTSDRIWVSSNCDTHVSCVTIQGKVKYNVKMSRAVHDISVSPATGNLWVCCDDRTVSEVSVGIISTTVTKQFVTDSCPWYLCMTPDNFLAVVSGDYNVTVYSATGQALHSTKDKEKYLIAPHHIAVCSRTGDIAVCDRGGSDKPYVAVFNSKLEFKYQYFGPPEHQHALKSEFFPSDIVYDSEGRLFIADFYNSCIEIVSCEGQFITVVHEDNVKPGALTLMQDGLLCVGFSDKTIKTVKYSI